MFNMHWDITFIDNLSIQDSPSIRKINLLPSLNVTGFYQLHPVKGPRSLNLEDSICFRPHQERIPGSECFPSRNNMARPCLMIETVFSE